MNEEVNNTETIQKTKVEEKVVNNTETVSNPVNAHKSGFAILSTLIGVIAIAFMWFLPLITLAASLPGLYFAIVSFSREKDVLSYLALAANIVALVLFGVFFLGTTFLGFGSIFTI